MSETANRNVESVDDEVTDPNCVADKPYVVTFQDITSASFLIKSGIERTPCSVTVLFENFVLNSQAKFFILTINCVK